MIRNLSTGFLAFLFLIFFSVETCAQEESFRITNRQASPETKMQQNDNVSNVDMFRGIVTSSIPIYTFIGREYNLPISLAYSSSGIKVDQLAGTVGLGWNLNVGGRITRVVNRIPDDDDYPTGILPECYQTESEIALSPEQRQDFYKTNVGGFEDIFKFFAPAVTSSLVNPKIHTSVSPGGYINGRDAEWIVTGEDGTKFYFGQNSVTEKIATTSVIGSPNCPNIEVGSTTAWLLTKIISKNSLDEYTFNYTSYEWLDNIPADGEGKEIIVNGLSTTIRLNNSSYRVNQQMLTSVYHNNEKIFGFNYAPREDLRFIGSTTVGNALSEILFYNYKSNSVFRKLAFTYTYFGNTDEPSYLGKRLKLDEITFYGKNSDNGWTVGDSYGFKYIAPESVPAITSFARDYLGLYNAKNTNVNLLPYTGHRDYNFEASLAGTLYHITYPSKGYAVFEYEQNAKKGGYGTTFIPQSTHTETKEIIYVEIETSNNLSCYELPEDYVVASPIMQAANFNNFPNNPVQYPSNTHVCNNVRTAIMRINQSGNYNLNASGEGIYLIQPLTVGCAAADLEQTCVFAFNNCLVPTQDIYYTGTASSQNNNYTYGGITNETSVKPFDAGNYQVTLWNYGIYSGVGITRNEEESIIDPAYTVNNDTIEQLTDGFRIRSITNYSSQNNPATKKVFKYRVGIPTDRINNVMEEHTENSVTFTNLSRGYTNAPEIINYPEVYEVVVDENGVDNGYTLNTFSFDYDYPLECHNYPFNYSNDPFSPVVINLTPTKNGQLQTVEIFNNDQLLVGKSEYWYNRGNGYDTDTDPTGSYGKFLQQSLSEVTKTDFFAAEDEIHTTTHYEIGGATQCDLELMTNEYETLHYFYEHPVLESQPTTITSSVKGTKKMEYMPFDGYFNRMPVVRYFVGTVSEAKQNQPLEIVYGFDYDVEGNRVTTTRYTPGTISPASYQTTIWGYSNGFPIATLQNIKYSDIEAARPQLIAEIQALSAVAVTPVSELALRNKLQELKSAYPDKMTSTFTYNPVFGMTSATDPKGQIIIYEYDALGRQSITKKEDPVTHEQFIVSENKYHSR